MGGVGGTDEAVVLRILSKSKKIWMKKRKYKK